MLCGCPLNAVVSPKDGQDIFEVSIATNCKCHSWSRLSPSAALWHEAAPRRHGLTAGFRPVLSDKNPFRTFMPPFLLSLYMNLVICLSSFKHTLQTMFTYNCYSVYPRSFSFPFARHPVWLGQDRTCISLSHIASVNGHQSRTTQSPAAQLGAIITREYDGNCLSACLVMIKVSTNTEKEAPKSLHRVPSLP